MMLKTTGKELRKNTLRIINIGIQRAEDSTLFRIIRPAYYTEGIYGKNMEVYPTFGCCAFVTGYRPKYDYRLEELPKIVTELERIEALLASIEDGKERTDKAYPLYFSFLNFCWNAIQEYEGERGKAKCVR